MRVTQAFRMAWKSILSNKLRTVLTMLGVVIGVAAVITLVSVSQGSTKEVEDQVASLGSNLLTVSITGRGSVSSLTMEEAMSFQDIEGVVAVSPYVSGNVQAKVGTNNTSVSVEGITAEYEDVRDYHVEQGRFILPIDVNLYQRVAIIGADAAEDLFGTDNPVGQSVNLNGSSFKIVGLMASKGTSLTGANDNKIWVPLTRAERLLSSTGIRNVYVKIESQDQADAITAEIETILNKKFRNTENSYSVYNQADMADTMSSISNTMALLMAGIASISLVVGGIGIMNIMLVSVTERTREIGIRKSLGAKKRDIMSQFMMEAVMISAISGLIGIASGIGGAYVGSKLMDTPLVLSTGVMWLAFGFSAAIGVIFGIFPANKAANLKPVDALRYD